MPFVTVGQENSAPIQLYCKDHGSGGPGGPGRFTLSSPGRAALEARWRPGYVDGTP
jgi:hypothetical protein